MFTPLFTFSGINTQWYYYLENFTESPFFWGIITIIIIMFLVKKTRKEFHSHWNTLLDGCTFSTREFYEKLEAELKETNISGMSQQDVYLREGGLYSSRRLYLRINWKEYRYDVCAAPFGNGFFISWWLLNKTGIVEYFISRFPLGLKIVKFFDPVTYYKIDTASMFQTYCHQAVLKVIEDMTNDSGIRALTEDQKKPLLNNKNIFKR